MTDDHINLCFRLVSDLLFGLLTNALTSYAIDAASLRSIDIDHSRRGIIVDNDEAAMGEGPSISAILGGDKRDG